MKPQDKTLKDQDRGLRGFLRGKGLSAADAEDAAQDSWVALLSQPGKFEGRSSLSTYLFGIGKNKAREAKRARTYDPLPESVHASSSPEGELASLEGVRKIEQCIDELPETQKAVLQARAFEQHEVNSIAKKMRLTANNVSVLLHRAKHFLTSCIHD